MLRRALSSAGLLLLLALVACERAEPDTAREPEVVERDPAPTPDAEPVPVTTTDSLRAALDVLVRGESGNADTWFSAQTSDVVRDATVDADGRAVVDFRDLRTLIPNASSSAGSEMLLRELNGAVLGVGGVQAVEYRLDGDCQAFGEWLQYGECMVFTRDGIAAGT